MGKADQRRAEWKAHSQERMLRRRVVRGLKRLAAESMMRAQMFPTGMKLSVLVTVHRDAA